MSLQSRYRQWSVSSTWAGSLGVGPVAGTHCRYTLLARGLIPETDRGVRHRSSPLTARTVAVNPGQEWRGGELALRDFDLQFTGGGLGRGPSFLPGSASVSWPSCPSRGSRVWFAGDHTTAQRFSGRGLIADCSDALGGGMGIQLLAFNVRWSVVPDVSLIRDIVAWARSGNLARVRAHIPMGAVCFGTQFGVAVGVTLYYGTWWPSLSRSITLPVGPDPDVGQPLPPGRRPRMGGARAHFERRHW